MNGLLGIGNARHGDDALGPVFARAFRAPGWQCWNAGTAPEKCAAWLRRAALERLIVLDAAELQLPPGSMREIAPGQLREVGFFGTHAPSLAGLLGYLGERIPEIRLVGIQPQSCHPGDRLSPPVRAALHRLGRELRAWSFHTPLFSVSGATAGKK